MAEAAGAAVGVVSLGLQVLQGLASYYTQYKSFSCEITAVVGRIARLTAILDALDGPVRKLECEESIPAEVRRSISECEAGIQMLKIYGKKCGEVKFEPQNMDDRLQLVKKKLLFPFRKGSLEDLMKNLDRLQNNVDTIIMALQLDTSIRLNQKAEAHSTLVIRDMTNIRRQQTYQTELMETIHNHTESHSDQISSYQTQMASTFSAVGSQYQNILEGQEQIFQKVQNFENLLERLRLCSPGTLPPPSSVEHACRTYIDLAEPVSKKLTEQRRFDRVIRRNGLHCTCSRNSYISRNSYSWWPVTVYRRRSTDHLETCPFSKISRNTTTLGLQFSVCARGLGYVVDASLTRAMDSLSPVISFFTVVPEQHLSFRLVSALQKHLASNKWSSTAESVPMDKCLDLFKRSMLQLFADKRASPRDRRSDGWTLTHALFNGYSWNESCKKEKGKAFAQLISFGQAFAMPPDEIFYTPYGQNTPLESLLLWHGSSDWTAEVQAILSDMGGSWSVRKFLTGPHFNDLLRHIPEDLYSTSNDDPLVQAIGCKSEADLVALLKEPKNLRQCTTDPFLLRLATYWPQGLQLLLDNGADTNTVDINGYNALDYAVVGGEDESVNLLLQSGCPITVYAWRESRGKIRELIRDAIIEQIKLEHRYGNSSLDTVYDNTRQAFRPLEYFYFEQSLTVQEAESFFNAGLCRIDDEVKYETPLWFHIHRQSSTDAELFNHSHLEVLRWFIQKGAKLDRTNTRYKTLPAHLLAERLAISIIVFSMARNDEESTTSDESADHKEGMTDEESSLNRYLMLSKIELLQDLFQHDLYDTCTCACSEGGCNTLSAVLRGLCSYREYYFEKFRSRESQPFQGNLEQIFLKLMDLIVLEVKADERSIAAIRVLTFNRLQLTHTCHNHNHNYYDRDKENYCSTKFPLSVEEVGDIQYSESSDITLLEDLVAEFDASFCDFEGSFRDFIEGPWEERMRKLDDERYGPKVDEQQKMEELGVILQPWDPYTEDIEDFEAEQRRWESWEWFEQEVHHIMNSK